MNNQAFANTTDDQDYMKEVLGMNPGLVNDYRYFGVSVEPVSFVKENDLGWGEEWSAIHSGFNGWDPLNKKNIEGRSITVTKRGVERGYKALLNEWKRAQEQGYVPGYTSLEEA